MKLLVLHGPNLNLLGTREPALYGTTTLAEIDAQLRARGGELGVEVCCRQSNSEGQLVDLIQEAGGWAQAMVINPGGYSHTSVAIRDAIAAVGLVAVEVHLTNPSAREPFRQIDVVAGACTAVVAGFGPAGYLIALEQLASGLERSRAAE
ncbi:MAG: type II 3-dehydroquinate dehydratase [Candidatus Dormibacteria bacterium]